MGVQLKRRLPYPEGSIHNSDTPVRMFGKKYLSSSINEKKNPLLHSSSVLPDHTQDIWDMNHSWGSIDYSLVRGREMLHNSMVAKNSKSDVIIEQGLISEGKLRTRFTSLSAGDILRNAFQSGGYIKAVNILIDLKNQFENADNDHSGILTRNVFESILRKSDLPITFDDVQKIVDAATTGQKPTKTKHTTHIKHIKYTNDTINENENPGLVSYRQFLTAARPFVDSIPRTAKDEGDIVANGLFSVLSPSKKRILLMSGAVNTSLDYKRKSSETYHNGDKSSSSKQRNQLNLSSNPKIAEIQDRIELLIQDKKWTGISLKKLKKAFENADYDNEKCVSYGEFRSILRGFKIPLNHREIRTLQVYLQNNQDGKIYYQNFVKICVSWQKRRIHDDEESDSFSYYSENSLKSKHPIENDDKLIND